MSCIGKPECRPDIGSGIKMFYIINIHVYEQWNMLKYSKFAE